MAKLRFIHFHGAVQWIVFGDSIPVFEPVEIYTPDDPVSKSVAPEDAGIFRKFGADYESLESEGAQALAEELLLDAIAANRVRLIGSDTKFEDDLRLINPSVVEGCSYEYDFFDGGQLYNDEKTYRTLFVSLDDLLAAFPFRPSEWRDEVANSQTSNVVPFQNEGSVTTPDQSTLARSNIRMTTAKIHQCKAFLARLVKQSEKPLVKAFTRDAAMEQIPGLSRRGFDKAWDAVVPDHWKVPGRKSKP